MKIIDCNRVGSNVKYTNKKHLFLMTWSFFHSQHNLLRFNHGRTNPSTTHWYKSLVKISIFHENKKIHFIHNCRHVVLATSILACKWDTRSPSHRRFVRQSFWLTSTIKSAASVDVFFFFIRPIRHYGLYPPTFKTACTGSFFVRRKVLTRVEQSLKLAARFMIFNSIPQKKKKNLR